MTIIKEVKMSDDGGESTCVIRSSFYGSQFSYIAQLVEIAKEDWPELKDDAIKVVHFGGDRYARTYGIEFQVLANTNSAIASYTEIPELEFTL